MLVYSPGGMLEVPPDTPHPGTLLIGIAKPVPVIRDMDFIRRLFSQAGGARHAFDAAVFREAACEI